MIQIDEDPLIENVIEEFNGQIGRSKQKAYMLGVVQARDTRQQTLQSLEYLLGLSGR
jgi:hypothetical protein